MVVRASGSGRFETVGRAIEIALGLACVAVSVVVLADPLISLGTLTVLLAVALAFDGLRSVMVGGGPPGWWRTVQRDVRSTAHWIRRLGPLGVGLIAVGFVAAVLLNPHGGEATLLYLLALGAVILGFGRVLQGLGREAPTWLRGSSIVTGALVVLVVGLAIADPSLGLATFAILIAVMLLLGGVQSVVSGLRPTDPRQIVLLKLVLFSLFYGLVLINWIDLFGKSVPAYGVWLVMTYFAPFWVLIIYEGYSEWPLALSLGLLVSLANDVGYFFVGNLLFGFEVDLAPWIEGQLGFQGSQVVTTFQAGAFSVAVASWMMGLSIYLRAADVSTGLLYWWRHPARIVARMPEATEPARPSA